MKNSRLRNETHIALCGHLMFPVSKEIRILKIWKDFSLQKNGIFWFIISVLNLTTLLWRNIDETNLTIICKEKSWCDFNDREKINGYGKWNVSRWLLDSFMTVELWKIHFLKTKFTMIQIWCSTIKRLYIFLPK